MSARDVLITSVTGLVRRRGVAGTGLNALLEDSGVARRTVYLNFPGGKAELVAEATRISGQALTTVLESADDGGDPVQAVQTFIDQWKVQLRATQMEAGCPIVAAILGRAEAPAAARAAAEAFGDWQVILADRLVRSGVGDEQRPLTGNLDHRRHRGRHHHRACHPVDGCTRRCRTSPDRSHRIASTGHGVATLLSPLVRPIEPEMVPARTGRQNTASRGPPVHPRTP